MFFFARFVKKYSIFNPQFYWGFRAPNVNEGSFRYRLFFEFSLDRISKGL